MAPCRGILLYSGGLDSLLTAKILMEQGIEVIGLHCVLPFAAPDLDPADLKSSKLAAEIGLPLVYYRCGDEYISLIKNPPHGYGKRMNPCIDCKIHFIKKAGELMKREQADFVATGEVVGQRPMSQLKHMLAHIEKETGLEGWLLRPMSAKLLQPTIAEEKGLVDRSRLYDINGRSRRRQIELVRHFGIERFASPAGGCLFTDPNIAPRVKDLIEKFSSQEPLDFYLLSIGRHFRIGPGAKAIVSKNEAENKVLEKYIDTADYFFIPQFRGPDIYVKGELDDGEMVLISKLLSRYGKPDETENDIDVYKKNTRIKTVKAECPIDQAKLEKMRI